MARSNITCDSPIARPTSELQSRNADETIRVEQAR